MVTCELKDGKQRLQTSLKITKDKWGAIPLRVKYYAGINLMSEIKLGHQVKKAETWLKETHQHWGPSRAEFQFLKSVNTLAKFHFKKGEKTPHPAGEILTGFLCVMGPCIWYPLINAPTVGHQWEKKLQQWWLLWALFWTTTIITHLILSWLCTRCNLLYESYI